MENLQEPISEPSARDLTELMERLSEYAGKELPDEAHSLVRNYIHRVMDISRAPDADALSTELALKTMALKTIANATITECDGENWMKRIARTALAQRETT